MKRSELLYILNNFIKNEADKAAWINRERTLLSAGYDGEVYIEDEFILQLLILIDEYLKPNWEPE